MESNIDLAGIVSPGPDTHKVCNSFQKANTKLQIKNIKVTI